MLVKERKSEREKRDRETDREIWWTNVEKRARERLRYMMDQRGKKSEREKERERERERESERERERE
jgi:hypothetical protein